MTWSESDGDPWFGGSRRDLQTRHSPMTPEELAPVLEQLGCPAEKSLEMAGQLERRARQLAERNGRSQDEALSHLLSLMQQGWAAKERQG